jgi:hypothetical protein
LRAVVSMSMSMVERLVSASSHPGREGPLGGSSFAR